MAEILPLLSFIRCCKADKLSTSQCSSSASVLFPGQIKGWSGFSICSVTLGMRPPVFFMPLSSLGCAQALKATLGPLRRSKLRSARNLVLPRNPQAIRLRKSSCRPASQPQPFAGSIQRGESPSPEPETCCREATPLGDKNSLNSAGYMSPVLNCNLLRLASVIIPAVKNPVTQAVVETHRQKCN